MSKLQEKVNFAIITAIVLGAEPCIDYVLMPFLNRIFG